MKIIRWVLGKVILFLDAISSPKPLDRSSETQKKVDEETKDLSLYQFLACPFCVKVRREIRRLNLNIDTRDAKNNENDRQELLEGGGKVKVPCLRIAKNAGEAEWMYESDDIVDYLRERFSPEQQAA